jgi:hypothetical protein
MAKYRVLYTVTREECISVDVEAKDEEQAIELAVEAAGKHGWKPGEGPRSDPGNDPNGWRCGKAYTDYQVTKLDSTK